MISIYKLTKEDFETIFAIKFREDESTFFFFADGEWEEDTDKIDAESEEFIFGDLVDVSSLNGLDLGESVDISEGTITCLANFENLGSVEESSEAIIGFLDSYAKMIDMV